MGEGQCRDQNMVSDGILGLEDIVLHMILLYEK